MSGTHRVPIAFTAVTAQVDILELVAHSARPLILLELHLYQTSDVGDAAEEILELLVKSGQTTSGSGGSSVTPVPNDSPGNAAGFTAEIFNTTKASAGTIVTHAPLGWNIRGPFDSTETDMGQIVLAAGRRLTVELAKTPADSLTIGGYAVCQEIGS